MNTVEKLRALAEHCRSVNRPVELSPDEVEEIAKLFDHIQPYAHEFGEMWRINYRKFGAGLPGKNE